MIGASRDGAPFGTEQTVTIADDEGIPAVTLVLTPPSIAEDGGTSTVTATVSPASTAFTVDVTQRRCPLPKPGISNNPERP